MADRRDLAFDSSLDRGGRRVGTGLFIEGRAHAETALDRALRRAVEDAEVADYRWRQP